MKQFIDNTGFALDESVVAMVLICIVFLGMAMLICVSMADFMRSWKRRAAR
jgi:Tfp pilus assembly protein PilV